jgi:hypothetical protein
VYLHGGWRCVVSCTYWTLEGLGVLQVPIEQEAGGAPEPIWTLWKTKNVSERNQLSRAVQRAARCDQSARPWQQKVAGRQAGRQDRSSSQM